ncbi:hypothetical protein N7532_003903 [Penicillium argentinense]|uniref:DUF676 domain-containing protein n=1 Tax=Penicillium argentinense TaxID=1131581 RepID=A0A9W9FNC3_9EURO|nr:uncharacterized protein N7532_003903 [Penicillium argentinense]KAJ5103374.1 hypothetical protein N7532_003903 [Penicillium argentinense]
MSNSSSKADHICVLVHGLWGNPSHLDQVASALRERHGDQLHVFSAKENSGNYTYDGIELGGERLAHEIEETVDALKEQGQEIKKLSVVGYSLGGLVARYAIGLLEAQGWLDKVEAVNFTTFASPHVGVRAPLKGWRGKFWNVMGARTVSVSGQQLFMVDSFRDTGRPLLSILADPDSIFIKGLKRFQTRSAYANIVNDRTTAFYTTALSKVDPFRDLDKININYVDGYEQVIIDPHVYLLPSTTAEAESAALNACEKHKAFAKDAPFWMLILLLIGPVSTLFLINSAIQTFRSQRRIKLHGEGKNGLRFGRYKVPFLIRDAQYALEEAFEKVNNRQEPAYLSSSDAEQSDASTAEFSKSSSPSKPDKGTQSSETFHAANSTQNHPKLALTPDQFAIIDSLNDVGFTKYPVHIHNHRHSHAAIIVRSPKDGFYEGKIVIKHWLDQEFVI